MCGERGGVALAAHPPADGGVGLPHDDAAARRQQPAERAAHERAREPGADDEDARGRGVGHRTIKSTPGARRNDASRALFVPGGYAREPARSPRDDDGDLAAARD